MPNGSCRNSSRVLKKSASFVLASLRSSTYPRGYASGLHSLRPRWTAILSILRYRGIDPISVSFSQASILHYSALSITYNEAPISFS